MTWTDIRRTHPNILEQLKCDFPHLRSCTIKRGGSDWVALVMSFASAHDLTFTEAGEVLQDWLSRRRSVAVSEAA